MMKRIIPYLGIIGLLTLSLLAFSYDRFHATAKTAQIFIQQKAQPAAYLSNDRYQTIVAIADQYPTARLYFLANSINPSETSTSWQLIQSSYVLYPRIPKVIKFGPDNQIIRDLGNTNSIVVTPFKQGPFFASAKEIHPHDEYYIYLFGAK